MNAFLFPVIDTEKTEGLIDFSVMIYDDRERTPIYLLNVMQDDDSVKKKVLLNNKNMERAIKHAANTETRVQLLNRVDLNMVNGVVRAVKELVISDVVIEWDERNENTADFLFNQLFGTATNNILDSTWETVYVCRLIHPVSTAQKIVLVLTKNAEYEIGFSHWVKKIVKLAKQVNAKILVCSAASTFKAFQLETRTARTHVEMNWRQFEEMEDFLVLSREIHKDDLIVVVSALGKGTLSYHSYMDNIPNKLVRHFGLNNFILLYPEQKQSDIQETGMQSHDITLTPIQEQIDNLNKIGKAMKKIFKGGNARTANGEDTSNEG